MQTITFKYVFRDATDAKIVVRLITALNTFIIGKCSSLNCTFGVSSIYIYTPVCVRVCARVRYVEM